MANRIGKFGSRRRGISVAMAGVVASMLFGVSQGHADTTDQLLDQLKAKGHPDESRVSEAQGASRG